ncbi:type VI secretion system secreted protein VgrG [Luteibacter rhizovicinus]|uniref:Type VI secretion system secreted protein VgrG n=1 Tax=Luteibacter rhizovicinus TaxID=242606 RepID=A0A4R3YTK8_9GAMM|nr:type VI secretion system tip protein TssI/VgrG [Luteibacter rhizovicinus]TCV95840.1 type VI secretion system secreted protein VgrG [Luteibacter rhizovicinus]
MARTITLQSDLGDQLLFAAMDASEALGRLFSFRLKLLGKDAHIDLRKLLGTSMTVRLETPDGYKRWFNGIVADIAQTGFTTVDKLSYAVYQATLVPKPWLLTHRYDCRIYTDMSVPEIVRTALSEVGYSDVKLSLSGSYPKREYCVQYREDTFNFISRLLEQEGIYYFFSHGAHAHTMVLADALGAHARHRPFDTLPYVPPAQQGNRTIAAVSEWRLERGVHPTRYQLTDYDPLRPRASLLAGEEIGHAADCHPVSGLEVFDFPGSHVAVDVGQHYAQVRAEAHNAQRARYTGRTGACGLEVGALFGLTDAPRREWSQEYLVIAARTHLEESGYASGDSGGEPFSCDFETIESKLPFRSLPQAVRPTIAGLQTAIVTGESDEDIAVDQHGRIQVTFHWNRPDKPNAKNSCPVRVASSWAGKNWGMQTIPRVGQEVVVSFLEGDPDRPLVIGSVYNADHMPPYALPDNKTQSGIKSRSHAGGGAEDANEIRFEDKKGSEEMLLHAQKDMREEVEHDHVVAIDHDETITIKNDQSMDVQHDRKHKVGNNNTLDVTVNGTTTIGQKFKLDAGTEIELVTGASSLVMKSSGEIEIRGINVTIVAQSALKMEGQVQVNIKAGVTMDVGAGASLKVHSDAMLQVEGGAKADVKAPMLSLNGEGIAQLAGGLIMIG